TRDSESQTKRPARSLPPSKPLAGQASPRRSFCAPTAMTSLTCDLRHAMRELEILTLIVCLSLAICDARDRAVEKMRIYHQPFAGAVLLDGKWECIGPAG